MAGDWLGDGTRWLGPPRGGGKGNRGAQTRRQAAKRRLARASAREAGKTAGEVADKRGRKVNTLWRKRMRLAEKEKEEDIGGSPAPANKRMRTFGRSLDTASTV